MHDEFSSIDMMNDPYCQAWNACAQQQQSYYEQEHDPRDLIVIREFGPEGESRGYADDATWILTASFVILTMQSGFGLLEAGSCSQGYEVNIMMKNLVDVAFGSLAYYLIGYGISFGQPSIGFMGLGDMPAVGNYDEVDSGLLYSRYIFQLSFAATSTTIVSGCVAQRLRFFVYVVYSFFSVIFYSFCAHWVFDTSGWLNQLGVHDFAGAGPVHLFGGINGLIGILFVGSRKGRFDNSRPISDFFPSSPLSQIMGLFMLIWGWIGFNCGSTFGITDDRWVVAIRTAVTTINSVVGGAIVSIMYSLWRTQGIMVIPEHIINGILASLVSITPACACVRTYVALPIGFIGAFLALMANTFICRFKLDDPVGGVGHHGISAMWGLIAVGLFADTKLPGITVLNGLFVGGGFQLLKLQLLEIIAITSWSIMWSTSFFYIAGVCVSRDWKNPRKGLRVCPKEEERGADWFLHGVVDMEAVAEELELSLTDMFGGEGGSHDFSRKRSHHDPAFFRSSCVLATKEDSQLSSLTGSSLRSNSGKGSTLNSRSQLDLSRKSSKQLSHTPSSISNMRLSISDHGPIEEADDEDNDSESTIKMSSLPRGDGMLPPLHEHETVEPSIDLSEWAQHDLEEGVVNNGNDHHPEGEEEQQQQAQELLNSMSQSTMLDSLPPSLRALLPEGEEGQQQVQELLNSMSQSTNGMSRSTMLESLPPNLRASLPKVGLRLLLAEARMGSSRRIQALRRQSLEEQPQQQPQQQLRQPRPGGRRGMLRHDENSRHLAQMYR